MLALMIAILAILVKLLVMGLPDSIETERLREVLELGLDTIILFAAIASLTV